MADFNIALQITLKNEGGFAWNHETKEIVNRGITCSTLIALRLLPLDLVADYTAYKTDGDESHLPAVIAYMQNRTLDEDAAFYREYYWGPLDCSFINDQNLANKVFDIGVNQGVGESAKMLQEAVNDLQLGGSQLVVDGDIGPATIAAVNAVPGSNLLTAFRARAEARYREIAANDPALAPDLDGWLVRLAS
jgi:lysozyme family protein